MLKELVIPHEEPPAGPMERGRKEYGEQRVEDERGEERAGEGRRESKTRAEIEG